MPPASRASRSSRSSLPELSGTLRPRRLSVRPTRADQRQNGTGPRPSYRVRLGLGRTSAAGRTRGPRVSRDHSARLARSQPHDPRRLASSDSGASGSSPGARRRAGGTARVARRTAYSWPLGWFSKSYRRAAPLNMAPVKSGPKANDTLSSRATNSGSSFWRRAMPSWLRAGSTALSDMHLLTISLVILGFLMAYFVPSGDAASAGPAR